MCYSFNKIDDKNYDVLKDGQKSYKISIKDETISCSCPGFKYRGICKHVVQFKESNPSELKSKRYPRRIVDLIKEIISPYFNKFDKWEIVGSYRRNLPTIKDIDIIALCPDVDTWNDVIDSLENDENYVRKVRGDLIVRGTYKGVELDINRVTISNDYVPFMLYRTGSTENNIKMRSIAKNKGMILNEHGLYRQDGTLVSDSSWTEKDYYNALSIEYKEPYQR